MDFCSFLVHIGGLITFSFFSLFSHCNCTEISKFSQSLLINVSTVGGIYLDNGFGYSIIDYRGNEEATWQEIDRGDVKRLAIWRISTKRSLRSRLITSRYITSPPHYAISRYLDGHPMSPSAQIILALGSGLIKMSNSYTRRDIDMLEEWNADV